MCVRAYVYIYIYICVSVYVCLCMCVFGACVSVCTSILCVCVTLSFSLSGCSVYISRTSLAKKKISRSSFSRSQLCKTTDIFHVCQIWRDSDEG